VVLAEGVRGVSTSGVMLAEVGRVLAKWGGDKGVSERGCVSWLVQYLIFIDCIWLLSLFNAFC